MSGNIGNNIQLSTTQLYKIVQSGGFVGRFLEPLLKTRLPLMKIVFKLLAKGVLIPLQLMTTAAMPVETH